MEKKMILMMLTERRWFEELIKRYGRNPYNWKFICPRCERLQNLCIVENPILKSDSAKFLGLSCIYRDCDHSHFKNDNPLYVKLSRGIYRNQMDFFDKPLVPRISA